MISQTLPDVPAVIENYSHCSNSVRCEMELRLTPLGPPWWSVIASWLWSRWILSPWLGPAIPTSYRADGCIACPGKPSGYLRMIQCWQAGRVSILLNGKEKGEIRNSAPKGDHYLQIYERWFIELIIIPLTSIYHSFLNFHWGSPAHGKTRGGSYTCSGEKNLVWKPT